MRFVDERDPKQMDEGEKVFKFLIMWFLVCSVIGFFTLSSVVWGKEYSEVVGKVVTVKGKALIRNEKDSKNAMKQIHPNESIHSDDVVNTSSRGFVKILFEDGSILDIRETTLFKVDEFLMKKKQVLDRKVGLYIGYGKIRALVTKKVSQRGKFSVRTKSATMGVRGTEFVVKATEMNLNMDQALVRGTTEKAKSEVGRAKDALNTSSSLSKKTSKHMTMRTELVVVKGKVAVQTNASKVGPAKKRPKLRMVQKGEQLVVKVEQKTITSGRGIAQVVSAPAQVQVAKLSAKQLRTEISGVKVKDQTFMQAINLAVPKDNESWGGKETLHAISKNIQQMKPPEATVRDIHVRGMFQQGLGLGAGFYPGVVGKPVHIRVVFKVK